LAVDARYDLVLRGGRLFEPSTASWQDVDIAVKNGVIAAVAGNIAAEDGETSAELNGAMITPGLTDLHVHAYPGATFWGIEIDAPSLNHGVTAVVDAGSAGAANFDGLAPLLRGAKVHATAFLNIAKHGLVNPYGELLDPDAADVEAAVRVAREHPDVVVGFKIRASPNTVGAHAAHALAAVRRAADDVGLPVMVHVSAAPPDLGVVLDHLRSGDVLTHCFTPYDNCVVGADGRPRPEVLRALERGVMLDVGHGSGSYSFPAAEAWASSGLPPAVVSTDLHARSVLGPAFDMCTVMTKQLAAGNKLEDVLRASTQLPAGVLGRTTTLEVGAAADIAVLSLEQVTTTLWDSRGVERVADERLRCRVTVRAGELVHVAPEVRVFGV
jgi:dihydroorotase